MARRHLNQEQRRGLIKDELTENPKKSDNQIAKDIGVSQTTVSRNREKLVEKGELMQCISSIGADGKERPRQVERKGAAVFSEYINSLMGNNAESNNSQRELLLDKARHLSEIHKAPSECWGVLVEFLLSKEWTMQN